MKWMRIIAHVLLFIGWTLLLLIGLFWYYAFQSLPWSEALLFCALFLFPGLMFVLIGKLILKRFLTQKVTSRNVKPLVGSSTLVFEEKEVRL